MANNQPHRRAWAVTWCQMDGSECGCYAVYLDQGEAERLERSARKSFPRRVVAVTEIVVWGVLR